MDELNWHPEIKVRKWTKEESALFHLKNILDAWNESESTIPVGKHEMLHATMSDARKFYLKEIQDGEESK